MAKRGSKVKVNCPVCGKVYTKAGLVGHLRFGHGKAHKAPFQNVEKPERLMGAKAESAKQKASLLDALFEERKAELDALLRKGVSGVEVAKLYGITPREGAELIIKALRRS